MNSGSSFLAEIWRITASLSPTGTVSVSRSVWNPWRYSRLTSSSSFVASLSIGLPPSPFGPVPPVIVPGLSDPALGRFAEPEGGAAVPNGTASRKRPPGVDTTAHYGRHDDELV